MKRQFTVKKTQEALMSVNTAKELQIKTLLRNCFIFQIGRQQQGW